MSGDGRGRGAREGLVAVALLLPALSLASPTAALTNSRIDTREPDRAAVPAGFLDELPAIFVEAPHSQAGCCEFFARGDGHVLYLAPTEATVSLPAAAEPDPKRTVVRMRLDGANPEARGAGERPLPGRTNFFIGADPDKWAPSLQHFAQVRYTEVYPGIDIVYRGVGPQVRYDFELAPGADPSRIRLRFDGVDGVSVKKAGRLALALEGGHIEHHAPAVFQDLDGERTPVDGRFVVHDDGRVGFDLGDYDARQALVIDPVLDYATYIGGSDDDYGTSMALDADGNIYMTGWTYSLDFPVQNAIQPGNAGDVDVFLTKLDPTGQTVLFSTLLGGAGEDVAYPVAIDSTGNIVLAGYTGSADFPVLNAAQPTYGGGEISNFLTPFGSDGFVAKLTPAGDALVFSTYLGGGETADPDVLYQIEWIRGLTIDGNDRIFVAGETGAPDFPSTQTLDGRDCVDNEAGIFSSWAGDGFTAIFAPDGTLETAVCVGGAERDAVRGVGLGPAGNIHLIGFTGSDNFPVTAGAFQTDYASPGIGYYDLHVTKLNSTASSILGATYLGGDQHEYAQRLVVAEDGSVYGAGSSGSEDFPTTAGAYQSAQAGEDTPFSTFVREDAVVFKLSPDLGSLEFASYLGGSGNESVWSISLGTDGLVYIAGDTASRDFPLVDSIVDVSPTHFLAGAAFAAAGNTTDVVAADLTDDFGTSVQSLIEAADGGILVFGNDGNGLTVGTPATGDVSDVRAIAVGYLDPFDQVHDLVVANGSGQLNRYYLSDGAGGFLPGVDLGTGPGNTTLDAVVIDVAGGFAPDIVFANEGGPNLVHVNDESGTFGAAIQISVDVADTRAIVAGNLDGSSGNDVIAINDGQPDRLYRNDGAGGFLPGIDIEAASLAGRSAALADLDGDGTVDLVVGNNGANRVYFNEGPGVFVGTDLGSSTDETTAVAVEDVDADGDPDIVTGNSNGANRVYLNDGFGSFADVEALDSAGDVTAAVVVIDADGDFDSDVIAGNAGLNRLYPSSGSTDAFIAAFSDDATQLRLSTRFGGTGIDRAVWGLDLDARDNVYLVGYTSSDDLPLVNAIQPTRAGRTDAFVMRIARDNDNDGIADFSDNCQDHANTDQRDGDGDGIGTACDPDHDQDCAINFSDLAAFYSEFLGDNDDFDYNGDGYINFVDLGRFKSMFFQTPGPSALPNPCD